METELNVVDFAGVAVIVALTFTAVFREWQPRTTTLLLGGAVVILWGTVRGFYNADNAIEAVSMQTLVLLVTMTVIANIMEWGGLFRFIGITMARITKGNALHLFIALSLFTYAFSWVADNLTVIVIMGTLTVALLSEINLDVRPFITAELIASNTGGASTAIGDFPNLLIAERGHIGFMEFLMPTGMFWVVLVIQIACLAFLVWQFKLQGRIGEPRSMSDQLAVRLPTIMLGRRLPFAISSRRAVLAGIAALAVALILFGTSAWHGFSPTEIGLLAAVIALIFSGVPHEDLLDSVGLRYVMAFLGLFILAGAVEHTGALGELSRALMHASQGDAMVIALMIMPLIAVVTALIDAGPTTAAFIPLIAGLEQHVGSTDHVLWWALSLGVLAGSSATILGATGGTIAAGHVERWMSLTSGDAGTSAALPAERSGYVREFSKSGVPIAGIMLGISAAYVVGLSLV